MLLNLIYDSSTNSAPAGFAAALTAAAQYLDALIVNPITVNISVGWGEFNGTPLTNESESLGGSAPSNVLSYNQVATGLAADANTAAAVAAFQSLPNTDPSSGAGFLVSDALQKAWGLLPATGTAIDGYVGFGTTPTYNFSTTNHAVANELDFMGVAEHELTHALGRFSSLGIGYLSSLDLYRYSAPGVLQTDQSTPFAPAYFSVNGGVTNLATFDTVSDNSDWAASVPNDAFDALSQYGDANLMSATDITEMNVLGFAVACFAAGTRIRTPRGEMPVEALRAGCDSVVTRSGAAARIVWIGARLVRPACHPRPAEVMPVRVCRGALGPGRPARDLYLSPDHALWFGGVLIPVRYLVNGRSIAPVAMARVRYFHVELARHDVLLAEGAPAESYLDTGNRASFAAGRKLPTDPARARRIWATQGCAELVTSGPRLIAARRRVLRRAAALGHTLTDDPALTVLADGTALAPLRDGAHWAVALPADARAVRLRSRVQVPAHTMPAAGDTRRLGIAIGRLWQDGREAALDSPALGAGWHAPEAAWRWTDGDGAILVAGAQHLAFDVAITGRYWAGG